MGSGQSNVVLGLLKGFAAELRAQRDSGHFDDNWITDGSYNTHGWLHGRLWAALVRATPPTHVPNLEVRIPCEGSATGCSYKPDLLLCDSTDCHDVLVELESSNSSDHRVVDRDLERLHHLASAAASRRPNHVLIVTVLADGPVKYLPQYGWDAAERAARRANPYRFHRDGYLAALRGVTAAAPPFTVAWANLGVGKLRLEYWDRPGASLPVWPTVSAKAEDGQDA